MTTTVAWGVGAFALAAALARLPVGLQVFPGVLMLAVLAPALLADVSNWDPLLAAAAAGGGAWFGGAPPDITTACGVSLAAGLASVGIAVRARRQQRTQHEITMLAARREELAAANAAQQEASEVAEAVLAATQDISTSHDAAEVAVRVARTACTATQSVGSAVLVWEAERESFRIAAVAGGGGTEVHQLEVSARGIASLQRVLDEGIADLPRTALHDPVLDALLRRWRAEAVVAARLQRGDRPLGVLLAARRTAAPAPAKTRRILGGIALQAAAALESANLVNDLRTASNLKEEFMATMSHELRTPLNVIIGYTDLQRDGAFGELAPDHLETLARVHEQALQLLDLIQATLDVGRLERGLMSVDLRQVSVPEVMEHLFASIPPAWRKPSVTLHWRVDPAVPAIWSDPAKLEVILRNLVHNALKFTDAGHATVAVTADPSGARVHFVVQDSGVGIAAQDLTVIFEMFRQSSTRDPAIGGVGLGLYIVKRLVELLGGEIDVRSAPGRGATFRVHLPIAGPHAAVPRPRSL